MEHFSILSTFLYAPLPCIHAWNVKTKHKSLLNLKLIYDWRSVDRSVLVSGAHVGPATNFFFLLEISFGQLRVYYFVAPSLTKGRVCNLLYNCFWALPEQPLLGRSPVELTALFYCLIWDFPNLEAQVPVFISSRKKVAQLYLWALGPIFVASCDSQGYSGCILTRLPTGEGLFRTNSLLETTLTA
jgi:hypothetical protein